MNKTTRILLAFTTGALAGIITGLLLAPDKNAKKKQASEKMHKNLADDLEKYFQNNKEASGCIQKEINESA